MADYTGNSAHRDLTALLEATFAEVKGSPYAHGGARDGKAVADLLRKPGSNVAEIDRRWRRGLTLGAKWPGCATFAELAAKWNHLADPGARTNAPRSRVGDLGVVYEADAGWWRDLSPDDLDAFLTERERLDPALGRDAPIPATGAVNVPAVEDLIARFQRRALPARPGASA